MDHLAVREGSRRCGVGRVLCAAIEEAARASGARIVAVQTATWNEDAIRFYERVGFTRRAVLPEYLGDGNDLVWLDIVLSPRACPEHRPER